MGVLRGLDTCGIMVSGRATLSLAEPVWNRGVKDGHEPDDRNDGIAKIINHGDILTQSGTRVKQKRGDYGVGR